MATMDGRTAIVTGGARGMGATHVRTLVAEGARVLFGDVRDQDGQALAAELGPAARYVHLDVADEDQWAAAVTAARELGGSIDVLVNNAAIVPLGAMVGPEAQSAADFRRTLEVNLVGTFLGMAAVLPVMKAQGGGSVVNISSIAALAPGFGPPAYTASKWGIRGLTKTAALEMAGTGVRVNSVHPGVIVSALSAHLSEDATAHQPIPRQGQQREISDLVMFLASDASSFSTGSEFIADGGALLGTVPTT